MFSSGKASHREPLIGGLEQDYLTPWNRFHNASAGLRKYVKRKYNKRQRRVAKRLIENELLQYDEEDDEETTEAS